MCNYLLLRKNFDLILIHKGGTGKTGSFQLAQLFAQLLGLLQNGDIVAAAQVCSLARTVVKSASLPYSRAIFCFAPGI